MSKSPTLKKAEWELKKAANRAIKFQNKKGNFPTYQASYLHNNVTIKSFNNCILAFVCNGYWYFGRDSIEFLITQSRYLGLTEETRAQTSTIVEAISNLNKEINRYNDAETVTASFGSTIRNQVPQFTIVPASDKNEIVKTILGFLGLNLFSLDYDTFKHFTVPLQDIVGDHKIDPKQYIGDLYNGYKDLCGLANDPFGGKDYLNESMGFFLSYILPYINDHKWYPFYASCFGSWASHRYTSLYSNEEINESIVNFLNPNGQ